jgi:transglutaminase-like putative cysteine protease
MNLRLLHRRLAVSMGLAGLVAFAGGAGFEPISAALAAIALVTALFWHPDRDLSLRMERVWLPLATILVVRAVFVLVARDDLVIPVVDLLLLLMAAEALRSLDTPNDIRLYALSFALMLAATAYRPGIVFLIAFVAFVGLATMTLMVGHVRRRSERYRVRHVPIGRGLVTTTAALSVVTMGVALVVFVTFPRVSRGWAGRGETIATSIAGFSDEVSIGEHGATISGNPAIVLRVEFPGGPPADVNQFHWRGRSYDRFDGVRWSRSSIPPSAGPRSWYRDRWQGEIVEQKIYGAPLDERVLFTLAPVLEIDSDNGVQPLFDNAGDWVYWGSGAPAYTVFSRGAPPEPDSLRAAAGGYRPSRTHFLQVPSDLDPRVDLLVDSLTAGLANDYDRAIAVQRYLQTFTYTLDLPARADQTSLEYFLFERRAGHCEYFSTALAVMLRTAGLRTRNVNGFLGGQWSPFGNYLAVTQNHAHSWVEVWFPEFGWVTFDATPSGTGTGAREEAWFWPGRILFDGIQHRWNKWVLDFSADDQSSILRGWSTLWSGDQQEGGQSTSADQDGPNPWGLAALLLLLAGGLMWAARAPGRVPPATGLYLRLRRDCARSGMHVPPGLTPLALVERLAAHHASAAVPAERVVDLYLRARYAGATLGESEMNEMRESLRATAKLLRVRA